MAEETLQQLEAIQQQVEELLADIKGLLGLGSALEARLFAEFMRDFGAIGPALGLEIGLDIRRELTARRNAQNRMLPLILFLVSLDTRIAEAKQAIQNENNENRKKQLHKLKIVLLLLAVLLSAIVLGFSNYSLEEMQRLKRKLFV